MSKFKALFGLDPLSVVVFIVVTLVTQTALKILWHQSWERVVTAVLLTFAMGDAFLVLRRLLRKPMAIMMPKLRRFWLRWWWALVLAGLAAAISTVFLTCGWRWGIASLVVVYYVLFFLIGVYLSTMASIFAQAILMIFMPVLFLPLAWRPGDEQWKKEDDEWWRRNSQRQLLLTALTFPFIWPFWVLRKRERD